MSGVLVVTGSNRSAGRAAELGAAAPLRRDGTAEEMVDTTLGLIGGGASHINATTTKATGGR